MYTQKIQALICENENKVLEQPDFCLFTSTSIKQITKNASNSKVYKNIFYSQHIFSTLRAKWLKDGKQKPKPLSEFSLINSSIHVLGGLG